MNKFVRYRLFALIISLLIFNPVSSQDFAWIKGANQINTPGDYGTTGVPAPPNNPGARWGAYTWKDAAGNFWLFGGSGYDDIGNYGNLSDLWKYTVATNQWAFIKGNNGINQISIHGVQGGPSPLNKPGGRHSGASWTDAAGNLWLMGGYGHSGVTLNLGPINDLWKYTISTNEWIWVNGSNLVYAQGEYGTQGVPSTTNTPGARMGSTTWTDASGKLWLFGGYGHSTSSVTVGSLDDVWSYDVTNDTWTWIKGTNLINQNGVYGTLGAPAAANNPGARQESTGWLDGNGNFWIIGGEGWDQAGTAIGFLNDMWKYNMTTNEWTWMRGSSAVNQGGVYGTQGTGSTANTPGGRAGSVSWMDAAGNVWMFGGKGYAGPSVSVTGDLNDLWKYKPATDEWAWIKGPSLVDQHGVYGTKTVPALTNLPGARTKHASWIDASNDLYIFGGSGQASAGVGGSLDDLWKYMNCYISPITMTITSHDNIICAGETTSLTASGSSNYLWLHDLSIAGYVLISPAANTTYTVLTADSKGCKYQAMFTQSVEACTGLDKTRWQAVQHNLYPNPSQSEFRISIPAIDHETQLLVFNAIGQQVFTQTLFEEETLIRPLLAKGIYHYQIRQSGQVKGTGKLAIE